MESYIEINVSLNGQHLFATAPRSIRSKFDLDKVLKPIKQKFTAKEGYAISVTEWTGSGKELNV